MTRVVLIGDDTASARILALVLAQEGIQVLDAQALEQEERAKQNLFELRCYDKVELHLPTLLLEPIQPPNAQFRNVRQQSRYAQSAKQQSLRAKARR